MDSSHLTTQKPQQTQQLLPNTRQGNNESTKGLDYELWCVSHIATNARLRLAEYQAALGDNQLDCRRLTRENENLQTLYDAQSDSLTQSWNEYNILNESLQEEVSKCRQLSEVLTQTTHELEAEVSRREIAETCLIEQENILRECRLSMDEKEKTIRKLEEDCTRYIDMVSDIKKQSEQERGAPGIKERIAHLGIEVSGAGNELLVCSHSVNDDVSSINENAVDDNPISKRQSKKRKMKS